MPGLFNNQSFLQYSLSNQRHVQSEDIQLPNGVRLQLWGPGVLRVIPSAPQQSQYRILLSSGIHGNETAPMELCDQLITSIVNNDLSVENDLLFVIGNLPAAENGVRFIDENLNRLFCNKHRDGQLKDTLEGQRAAKLESFTERFFADSKQTNLHYDLHTAIRGSQFEKFAVYPLMPGQKPSKTQLGFLERCELQAALLSSKPSTTYSYYTCKFFNAHSFTVELGQVKPFGENDLSKLTSINTKLRCLIANQEDFSDSIETLKVFTVVNELIKRTNDFELLFPGDTKNFTAYCRGALLARDGNHQYETTHHLEHIVFPNANVSVGHRALLLVTQTTLS